MIDRQIDISIDMNNIDFHVIKSERFRLDLFYNQFSTKKTRLTFFSFLFGGVNWCEFVFGVRFVLSYFPLPLNGPILTWGHI